MEFICLFSDFIYFIILFFNIYSKNFICGNIENIAK